MNKHGICGLLFVVLAAMAAPWPAHSEALNDQESVRHMEAFVTEQCTKKNMSPALCECELDNVHSPDFLLFAKTVKPEEIETKMNDYYIHQIVTPCMLNRGVSQKVCIQTMKAQTTEYSDQVINDFCECMAEEIDENVSKENLAALSNDGIRALFATENEKAFKACDRVRVK